MNIDNLGLMIKMNRNYKKVDINSVVCVSSAMMYNPVWFWLLTQASVPNWLVIKQNCVQACLLSMKSLKKNLEDDDRSLISQN